MNEEDIWEIEDEIARTEALLESTTDQETLTDAEISALSFCLNHLYTIGNELNREDD